MSYRRIRDEVLDAILDLPDPPGDPERKIPVEERLPEAQQLVLRRHVRDGDLSPLVAYAVENFDTVGGDDFIRPLGDALVEAGALRDLRRLWKGIIANRRRASGKPRPDGDLSLTRYEQRAREAAVRAMEEYAADLRRLGEEEEARRMEEDVAMFRAGARRKLPRPTPDRRPMDEEVFWEIIAETAGENPGSGEHVDRLARRLERFPLRAIRAFQRLLLEKLDAANHFDLWAVAHLARDGCGDDAFDYFRAWLVLQGRERFSAALDDPESAADGIGERDPQCEALLYAAERAYESRTDAPMKEVPHPGGATRGREWTEADLPERFPRLWARFGGAR